MVRISYCPLVGGPCKRPGFEIAVEKDTFFLVQSFHPKQDRRRRELAVKNSLKEVLKDDFSEKSLRTADKDPKEAIFCDICRMIQSSAYGIIDISGSNPNVFLELGMMLSLGKAVFVLVKKTEQESLKQKLPSDILWKRVIPYDEFIDIQRELCAQVVNRPPVETELPLVEQVKKVVTDTDPELAKVLDAKLKQTKEELIANLRELLAETKLGEVMTMEEKIEIPRPLEKRINELYGKVGRIEKLLGAPKDPQIAFLTGNWYYNKGKYESAIEFYDWTLILNPDSYASWHNKGLSLANLGRHEEAIVCFDKAIAIKPYDERAYYGKGFSLDKLGKREEAIHVRVRAESFERARE